ncbi:hypothetical protein [Methylomonas rapida]|uniref:Uncharacterized protein n=1 Tax=Methylomonas rapida TaxID=2963939 RepID=A0ABY7GRB0_9GAMM|nr:hypothetical protein [Methylomonas rapida]WAR46954.1 hypothetical protein NM686_010705 [Methylomonas rapida]
MLKVDFENRKSPEDIARHLDGYRSQIPFATSLAINRTADLVRKAIVAEMKRVFDRPTPFTLNSLYVSPSNKDKLEAVVWLKDGNDVVKAGPYATMTKDGVNWSRYQPKDIAKSGNVGTPATKYLGPEIFGGQRNARNSERRLRDAGLLGSSMFTTPAKGAEALLDKYGNMSGSFVKQILSGLQAADYALGWTSNVTARSIARNPDRAMYFVVGGKENPQGIARRKPGLRDIGKDSKGKWQVTRRRSPKGQAICGPLEPVLWFVKAPNYEPRLDFFGIGRKAIDENLERELVKAMKYAIKTAR